ncbi:MAG: SET domain-containing protein [Flavisolibacter sp.]
MTKKKLSFLYEGIYVGKTTRRGRGMYTEKAIPAGTVIEIAPVIVLSANERKTLDQTLLHDYIFEWGDDRTKCCMALGYIPLYNHSYQANCEYEMEFAKQIMQVLTVRNVKAGEELFINYNGTWNDEKKIWFNVE